MKLKKLLLLIIPSLLLSSCTFGMNDETYAKDISVYNLDAIKDGDLNSGNEGKIKARFYKEQGYVPYISLKQYASLYNSHFDSDVTSKVEKSYTDLIWTVRRGQDLYFALQVDLTAQYFIVMGSLDSTYKPGDEIVDTASLLYGANTTYDAVSYTGRTYARYSYAGLGFKIFNYSHEYYFPLGLLDITCSEDSGIYYTYNYDSIYSSKNADRFSEIQFNKNGETLTVNSQMKKSKKDSLMPAYLREYNANLFLYLLDNFYGLKENKNISSSFAYCKQIGTIDALSDENDQIRAQAYADTLSKLDDNHTALVSVNDTWGEQSFVRRKYGDNCRNRAALMQSLNNKRASMLSSDYCAGKDILYSSDGETAMFLFDAFIYGTSEQVFNEDGSIKDTAEEYDSFFYMINAFNKIKAKGGVKNVVIDISTNGGDTLGVMMKLLSLISNNDESYMYYLQDAAGILGTAFTTLDINKDGKYDASDCYGDDFNIFILTSDCSYSCGNAFPCLAQKFGSAKIIGQKSGGGECAVAIHYLPNSEYVYHSSNLHLGYYDAKVNKFTGFEEGATPDIDIENTDDYYSIEKIASYVTAA